MRINDIPWEKLREKVECRHLAKDTSRNFQLDIIKLEPNTSYDKHMHSDLEWVYVLKGSYKDENGNYEASDFIVNEKGSMHTVTSGEDGAELLVYWSGVVKRT